MVQDESEPEVISYWTLLGDYLEQLPKAVAEYSSLLRSSDVKREPNTLDDEKRE